MNLKLLLLFHFKSIFQCNNIFENYIFQRKYPIQPVKFNKKQAKFTISRGNKNQRIEQFIACHHTNLIKLYFREKNKFSIFNDFLID